MSSERVFNKKIIICIVILINPVILQILNGTDPSIGNGTNSDFILKKFENTGFHHISMCCAKCNSDNWINCEFLPSIPLEPCYINLTRESENKLELFHIDQLNTKRHRNGILLIDSPLTGVKSKNHSKYRQIHSFRFNGCKFEFEPSHVIDNIRNFGTNEQLPSTYEYDIVLDERKICGRPNCEMFVVKTKI